MADQRRYTFIYVLKKLADEMGLEFLGERQIEKDVDRIAVLGLGQLSDARSLPSAVLYKRCFAHFDMTPIAKKKGASARRSKVTSELAAKTRVLVNACKFVGLGALDAFEGREAQQHIGIEQREVERERLTRGEHVELVAARKGLRRSLVIAQAQLGPRLVVHGQYR
jgi:hypothetical protein